MEGEEEGRGGGGERGRWREERRKGEGEEGERRKGEGEEGNTLMCLRNDEELAKPLKYGRPTLLPPPHSNSISTD